MNRLKVHVYAYDFYMCATLVTRIKVKNNLYMACHKTVG